MIRNDRQHRITRAQAEAFERSLAQLMSASSEGVPEAIRKAQIDALRSQLQELREELAEYESLQAGTQRVLELASLEELPLALIRARIAARMTQRELAERLGVKEQQIQRYEATNYMSASLARIKDVAKAVGLTIREDVFLPGVDTSYEAVVDRLGDAGIDRLFVEKRLLAPDALNALDVSDEEAPEGLGLRLAAVVNRVFGWSPAVLFAHPGPLPATTSMAVRFKVPANAAGKKTLAQAVYVRYLAGLVVKATPKLEPQAVPTDAQQVRAEIDRRGSFSLRACLDYAWALGIPVLPLHESGGFHGATWRFSGRNIIVLKQTTRSEARWMHDFLHELRHAAQDPNVGEFETIDLEKMPAELREAPEEKTATLFAGNVALAGRAEELADQCVRRARGRLEWLKSAVPAVASQQGVRTDVLANYMAYRLALQGENWWGAAINLQATDAHPYGVARDFLAERLNLTVLDATDRQILSRALEG